MINDKWKFIGLLLVWVGIIALSVAEWYLKYKIIF